MQAARHVHPNTDINPKVKPFPLDSRPDRSVKMKLLSIALCLFLNILIFGMSVYFYLLFSKHGVDDEPATAEVKARTLRRSAVGLFWKGRSENATNSSGTQSGRVIVKSEGSPRFPNIHTPVLEFDSDRYRCNDSASAECAALTATFGELVQRELNRVLMSESKVFKSGLASQNIYNVRFEGVGKRGSGRAAACALAAVRVRTVAARDEPFASRGFAVPRAPLRDGRNFDTCAVVTNSGALLGSRLGEFIDSHEAVVRFNNAPTADYARDVGTKTTFRVLNSQVVTKPVYHFLSDPLYDNTSIIIWDPANYSSDLHDWFRHPDYPLFDVYKRLLQSKPDADVHLLMPQILWDIWTVLQKTSPYRLRKNPPSSGFIGIWFALQRCARVRVFEFVPSARATARCHYYGSHEDKDCTLGSWHPLAQEKVLAERMRNNTDHDVYQRGFIEILSPNRSSCVD